MTAVIESEAAAKIFVLGFEAGATAGEAVDDVLAGNAREIGLAELSIAAARYLRDVNARLARQAKDTPTAGDPVEEFRGLFNLLEIVKRDFVAATIQAGTPVPTESIQPATPVN